MITFLTNNKLLNNIKSEEELIKLVTDKYACHYLEEYEILDFEESDLNDYDDGKYFVRKNNSYLLIQKKKEIKIGFLYNEIKIKYNILKEWKIIEQIIEDESDNNIDKIDNTDNSKNSFQNNITSKTKSIIIGPIGCGKTTRIKELIKYLIHKNISVKVYSDIDYSDVISKDNILESFDDIKELRNTFIVIDKFKNTNNFRAKLRDEEIRKSLIDESNGLMMSMTFPILISNQINNSIDYVFMYEYNRDFIMRILNRRYCPNMNLDEFKNIIKCEKSYELVVLDKKSHEFFNLDKF